MDAPCRRTTPADAGGRRPDRRWSARSAPSSSRRGSTRLRRDAEFPRDVFTLLGQTGLLSLPFDEEHGGGGQPYEVYLQVLEEIATVWMSVGRRHLRAHAVGVGAGTLRHRRPARRAGCRHARRRTARAPTRCPSRRPDRTSRRSRPRPMLDGDDYVVNGTKAWISHGPHADFWLLFARTGARSAARPVGVPRPGGHAGGDASARPRRRWA